MLRRSLALAVPLSLARYALHALRFCPLASFGLRSTRSCPRLRCTLSPITCNLLFACTLLFLLTLSSVPCPLLFAQTTNATITGFVTDPQKALIPGAKVIVINMDTNLRYTAATNQEGSYTVPGLPPGNYKIEVEKQGFKSIVKPDVVLHVQDAIAINFKMAIGSASESITVIGGAPLVNTESAAVSTVVDRQFVENIPLNGRSFQGLILLTPGVATNSPQAVGAINTRGEFSVNGQRTESNYYTVDGVSANVSILAGNVRVAITGSLPASTVLGTTQGLASVEALEEFRVQSSTYAAEFGRNPGGQFSFVTRSGTNQWHGRAFDYLRNDVFDANNWFNNFFSRPQPPLRQNDFGGTLGGPLQIPRLYDGIDKTFFFFSYEGVRLVQPQEATVAFVPDATLRQSAPSALQPVLNAFPVSNCTGAAPPPNCPPPSNGLAGFIGTWSNPSQIDSTTVRFDHAFKDRLRLFFRFSDTNSTLEQRSPCCNPSAQTQQEYTIRTYTLGATSAISSGVSNEFRLNYSSNESIFSSSPADNFGGAQPADLIQLQGIDSRNFPFASVSVNLFLGANSAIYGVGGPAGKQRQWNLVDAVSFSSGRHQFKAGVDFRRLAPFASGTTPLANYFYFFQSSVQQNSVDLGFGASFAASFPVYVNFSAFVQDERRLMPRLHLSMGLRWEVNPAPGGEKSNRPYTVEGSSLSTLTLAPQGTPLWNTTWYNFAPRLGVAYLLRNSAGFETVVRGGVGVFFDTGQQLGSLGFQGPGFSAINTVGTFFGSAASFPLPFAQINPAIVNPPTPPWSGVFAFPQHLQLPYTLQWNTSIQQSLGKSQALTVSYVGSNGRRLLEQNRLSNVNSNFSGPVTFIRSGLTSDYHALQVQFQRRLNRGLTALASYTWSHSIDFGSENAALPFIRGNSDFDVRHNFSGAFSYELPHAFQSRFARSALHHWGLDGRFTARTGFPVTLFDGFRNFVDPMTGQIFNRGVNLTTGFPLYVRGSQFPGGRAINPAAFSSPPAGQQGNAPRNFARGFGAWQMDLAIRREFPIYERLKLQFRAEAFNVFNHPNFGAINGRFGQSTFGQATATLAQSLGILSPLYQGGGPRSMQLALRLTF